MSLFDHERVLLKVRKHPIVFILRSFVFVVLGAAPLMLTSLDIPGLFGQEIDDTVLILAGAIYYLTIALFLLFAFFDHHLDVWLVTDAHVIDIQQNSLFNRNVAKQQLSRIQDVEAEVKGVLPTLFNYGNILIQTAGTTERITFTQVPNPHAIADTIVRLMHDVRDAKESNVES